MAGVKFLCPITQHPDQLGLFQGGKVPWRSELTIDIYTYATTTFLSWKCR